MKKDIKWLKEEVGELNLVDTVFEADGVSYIDTAVSVMQVYDLIDELDEPEVLSQEWIEEHTYYEDEYDFYYADPDELKNLLVPKQELPVIPKFVADWVLRYRDKYDLYSALRTLENNKLVWGLIYEWYRTNTHKFVNAYLTGEYEVAEEPLHYALIKGHELVADHDALSFTYWNFNMSNGYLLHGNKFSKQVRFLTKMTKEDWNKLGINDSNADFVKVEE